MNYKFEKNIEIHNIENISKLDIINYFSFHKDDNLYLSDGDKYLGFVTKFIYAQNLNRELKDIVVNDYISNFYDYINDHEKIINYFEKNKDMQSVPVFNNNILVGEFKLFNRYNYTFQTQKKINAFRKFNTYSDLILQFMNYSNIKKIGYLCSESDIDIPCFMKKTSIENIDDFDLVLDSYLPNEFTCIYQNHSNVIDADDFLSMCILYKFKEDNLRNIYFINEPIPDKSFLYQDELNNLNNENKVIDSLNDKLYFEKIYNNYPEDYNYMKELNTYIHRSTIVRNNGVYNYIQESVVKDDFKDGERVTPSNNNLTNSIEIYGPCTGYSLFTSRFSSLNEFMKQICLEKNIDYDIKNLSVPNGGDFLNDIIKMIYHNNKNKRIIIFINKFSKVVWDFINKHKFNSFSLTNAFKNHHYWYFNQNMHLSPKGNKLAAEFIMNNINISNASIVSFCDLQRQKLDERYYLKEKDVENYKKYLLKNKVDVKGKIGFIEVNASPLTKGHQYLIDYASKNCDFLYLFVTENNKNALPFFDRFSMIKHFCNEYKNIKVLSGSDFIGSQYTLTAYYNKRFDMVINPKEDILNFKEIFIPILDIDYRFMGEEPDSKLTDTINQEYLKSMKEIGKKTIIIPRLYVGDKVVSASTVRKNLASGNLENIKTMVSENVFNYLVKLKKSEYTEG